MIAIILSAAAAAAFPATASEWWVGGPDPSLGQLVGVAHGCGDGHAKILPIPDRNGNMVVVADASGARRPIRCAMDWWRQHPELKLTPLVQPAPAALARQIGPEPQSVREQRALFDALLGSLDPSLDAAEKALIGVPAKPTLQQWMAVKPVVFRANDLCGAMGLLFKSAADRVRGMPEGDEKKFFTIEIAREIELFTPVEQRQLALLQLVLAKRPPLSGAQAAARSGEPVAVTAFDYPPAALRLNHEGRVGYRLSYGVDGRATRCTVTASSGHAELDEATCQLMTRRSRFAPGAAGVHDGSVSWRIPSSRPPASGEAVRAATPGQPGPGTIDTTDAMSAYQQGRAQAAAAMGTARPQ